MRHLKKTIDFDKEEGKIIKEAIDNKDASLITKKKYAYIKSIIECSELSKMLRLILKLFIPY